MNASEPFLTSSASCHLIGNRRGVHCSTANVSFQSVPLLTWTVPCLAIASAVAFSTAAGSPTSTLTLWIIWSGEIRHASISTMASNVMSSRGAPYSFDCLIGSDLSSRTLLLWTLMTFWKFNVTPYYTVLPGCNNLWAFIKISKILFHCISSLPSSHPSYPRALRRIGFVVQGVTIADNGGQ